MFLLIFAIGCFPSVDVISWRLSVAMGVPICYGKGLCAFCFLRVTSHDTWVARLWVYYSIPYLNMEKKENALFLITRLSVALAT